MVPFQVYVNSFLALLNARYYTRGVGYYTMDMNRVDDPQQQRRPFKFRPVESPMVDSQCIFPDDDVLFPARPAQVLTHVSHCIIAPGRGLNDIIATSRGCGRSADGDSLGLMWIVCANGTLNNGHSLYSYVGRSCVGTSFPTVYFVLLSSMAMMYDI